MRLSEEGARFLGKCEGFRTHMYDDHNGKTWEQGQDMDDAEGYWTIGIGHLVQDHEFDSFKVGITEERVFSLFQEDVEPFVNAVDNYVTVDLHQHEIDALISFAFNIGVSAFRGSTLVKLLNQGLKDDVPAQLRRWNRSKGKVMEGLKKRREKEVNLWSFADYSAILD